MSSVEHWLVMRYEELGETPDALVELALLGAGELSGDAELRARRLAREPEFAATLTHAGLEPSSVTAEVSDIRGGSPERPRRSRWWVAAPLLLAAAVALLVLVPSQWVAPSFPEAPRLVPKGGADTLQIAVQRGGRSFQLEAGGTLQSGDRVGLFYGAEAAGHLVVFYRDRRGVTRLFPRSSSGSQAIGPAREGRLDGGARLNDGTGCAWFIGVFADEPMALAELEDEVREAHEGDGCQLSLDMGRATVLVPTRWGGP